MLMLSQAVLDFLMQCFQKDPNLRVSAKKLLKHPWIVNARRTDSVVPIKPTKYDEAVKSVQQWNKALKSPENSIGRYDHAAPAGSPVPSKADPQLQSRQRPLSSGPFTNMVKETVPQRLTADVHSTSEKLDNDNWDDDFASSISSSALQLPHLKPVDNFGGMLSSEKLKAFATIEPQPISSENWDDDYEDTCTVRSPTRATREDQDETVRPASPFKTNSSLQQLERFNMPPQKLALRNKALESKISLTPDLYLARAEPPKRSSSLFREDTEEDFSDLIPEGDVALDERLHQVLQV